MSIAIIVALVWVAAIFGIVLGGILGANARRDLEIENADLRRRLLARYEEHA